MKNRAESAQRPSYPHKESHRKDWALVKSTCARTGGKNLSTAFELAQEVENICHQYIIALKLGQPKILSFKEMKKVLVKAKNYKKG